VLWYRISTWPSKRRTATGGISVFARRTMPTWRMNSQPCEGRKATRTKTDLCERQLA
jgi:hypothetical protein